MRIIITIILCVWTMLAFAQQETRLAQEYFNNGEYEKAQVLYQKIHEKQKSNSYYFSKLLSCYINLENYTEAEEILKKRLKKRPDNYRLYLDYGDLYEAQNKSEEALAKYEQAIEVVGDEPNAIRSLAGQFQNKSMYDYAIRLYEKGKDNPKAKNFRYYLAELYRKKGEREKMIENYLISVEETPSRMRSVKTVFQRYFTEEDFTELQTQLYTRIQDEPENEVMPEMLAWVFIHRKDYKGALRQAKALDRKNQEDGGRVYQVAMIAMDDKDWKTAISGFEYIVNNKEDNSSYYVEAKQESLRAKRAQLVEGYDYSPEELKQLEGEYEAFLGEFGKSKTTAPIIIELAELEAYYINDLDKAISLLQETVEYPMMKKRVLADAKISLADFYLMKGEVWESTLLYSQVDKDFQEDLIGQKARYKNALLAYFAGDFEWAETQFSVLKRSTSKLIANDALDRSVFISDNIALDTTTTPLKKFSEAELLIFQNRFDDAFSKLDSIRSIYPDHSLEDDTYYLKAQIYKKQKNYEKAALMLNRIIEKFPEDIRADNAVFELAELYENQLENKEQATKLYEKILFEYSGSTFSVEARKRYRKLLGEEI